MFQGKVWRFKVLARLHSPSRWFSPTPPASGISQILAPTLSGQVTLDMLFSPSEPHFAHL